MPRHANAAYIAGPHPAPADDHRPRGGRRNRRRAPTLLTATPAVLAPTPSPAPIPTLLGAPEPEKKSAADILFGPDPAPPLTKTQRGPARSATASMSPAGSLFEKRARSDGGAVDLHSREVRPASMVAQTAPPRLPQPKPRGRGATGSAPTTTLNAGRRANPILQAVPTYKAGFFTNPAKNPPGTFQRFTGAVGNLAGASTTETRIYQEIFAAEGGVDVAPNGASSGITRTTLNDTIDRQKFGAVPPGTRPDQLTVDQRAAFYRAYFDDVLGAAADALSKGRDPNSGPLDGHDLLDEIPIHSLP